MPFVEGGARARDLGISINGNIYSATSQAELVAALAAATAGNGDIILIPSNGIEVSSTVVVAKAGVRIIATDEGLNPLAQGEFNAIYAAAGFTDGPVMQVTAPCELKGLGFAGRDTGALFWAGASLLLGGNGDANPFGVWIHGCRFPKWGWDARIGIGIEGSSDVLIEDCSFEGVTSALAIGIYVQGATQNLTIRRNIFRQVTMAVSMGAFAGGGPHLVLGPDNITEDGKLLAAVSAATGTVVRNLNEGATDTGSYGSTVDTLNGLGLTFTGNEYAE